MEPEEGEVLVGGWDDGDEGVGVEPAVELEVYVYSGIAEV